MNETTQTTIMPPGAQVTNGDMWEAACYFAAIDQGLTPLHLHDERNNRFSEISRKHASSKEYKAMVEQASKIMKKVITLEPQSTGISGLRQTRENPSDLEITTSTEVNYGISCKYATGLSHPETRSFRFGQSMLVEFGGMAVTKTFSDVLKSIHQKLDNLSKKYSKFSELPDGVKEREIIRPTRDAFVDFIKESNDTNPSEIIKALHEKALGSYPLYFARGGGHCGLHAIDFQGRLSAKKTATPTTIVSVKKGGGVSNEIDIDFGTYTMNIRLKNKDSSISRGAIATSVTLSDEFWKTYEVELP